MTASRNILSILALCLQILGDSEEDKKVYAAAGTTVDIYCGTSKDDAQHGNWTYQEKERDSEKKVPADVIEKTTKLEFRPVKETHSGTYSCVSSNTTIVRVSLSVGEAPEVPRTFSVHPNLDEGEYSSLDISWNKNGNTEETE
ncbi:hypothetical protein Aduo_008503 [Ancylostoma duodenale]